METPDRLGPYQSEEGHLYFFMEPSETDNLFMAVRSTDGGGVDADRFDDPLHLLFITPGTRSIYHTQSSKPGVWSTPRALIEGIAGSWVRGSIHRDASGNPVYGFVHDAGSTGGSGFNRYFALPLR